MLVGVLLDRGGRRPRRAEPVGAHPDQLLLAGLVQVRRRPAARSSAVPSLKMFPTSIAGSIRIACAVDRVAVDDGPDVDASRTRKSRPGSTPRRCRSGLLAPVDVRRRDRPPRRAGSAARSPTGPMNPGGPSRAATSSGCAGRNSLPQRERELDLVDAVVAAHARRPSSRRRRRSPGTPSAARRRRTCSSLRDRLDRRHPGRVHLLGRVERRRQRHRLRRRRSRPRGWPRSRPASATSFSPAAHGAMYSWAPMPPIIPTSASTRYHSSPQRSNIRSYAHDVLLVGDVEPLAVAVERVRVLHDELARPQHAGARPRLVALLDLEVVEDQRQVAV